MCKVLCGAGAGRRVSLRRGDVGVRGPRGGRGPRPLRAGGGGGGRRAGTPTRRRTALRRRARPPEALCRLRLQGVPGMKNINRLPYIEHGCVSKEHF